VSHPWDKTVTTALSTHDDYLAFCDGVRRLCQVDLRQYKRGQMERRIRSFAARRGATRLGEYLSLLTAEVQELESFLDRMTINVSQLWRNPEQWNVLAREVLPQLADRSRIKAWSAGCSYGAEAYTLAAVCLAHAPTASLEIRGTDIDVRMVERAREGRFSAEDARTAPRAALDRFFEPEGEGWRAASALKQVTRFETGDLLQMPFPSAAYDLVLCRNTVIYFTDEVRDGLHTRLAGAIRAGGYLMIGSTERVSNPPEIGLVPVRPFIYRKA
jgi:chemotaxis protein methyltransferase CheR